MSYISKYELEALGEPLGECVTVPKLGGGYFCGGGGGGPTSTTVTQSNIPDWLAPQVQAMLGAATEEFFTTEEDKETGDRYITGIKPYTPYSKDPQDYVAPFTDLQQSAFDYAHQAATPWEYGLGGKYLGQAGQRGADLAQLGTEYGASGFGSGALGEKLGVEGGEFYGGMGAGYGAEAAARAPGAEKYGEAGYGFGAMAADLSPEAQQYGRTAADIGSMGLRAEQLGRNITGEARGYAGQSAGLGGLYERMATSTGPKGDIARFMSPYQEAVIARQKEGAIREKQIADQARKSAAARAGAFGGSRQAIEQAEAERALQSQLQGIEATGLQRAYEQAQGNILNRAQLEAQGLAGAQQGLGTALQGGQLGLSGIGQAMAGQQAGLQGLGQAGQLYGLGMQGAGMGLQGMGQMGQLYGLGMQGAGMGLQGVQQQLAGTAQGMQGAGMGMQGVGQGLAGYGLMGQMGSQLGALGGQRQRSDMDIANLRYGYGQQQQAREQQIINQAIQDFARGQERPYDLLSMYNALIRGYATPGQTVAQYQAPASSASQLAGLGTAGIGLAALSRGLGAKAGGLMQSSGVDELALQNALRG